MYYYVYDEFLSGPKWERELSLIETRLTDLGIAGKIARLALFRDPTEFIKDEIRKGAKTIVAVGNDITLRRVMDAAAESKVAIGFIPLGKEGNRIAKILGIPSGVAACDVLSARIIENLDMGSVDGRRFLHTVEVERAQGITVECDGIFKVSPVHKGELLIRNLADADNEVRAANPADGKLEVVIKVHSRSWFGGEKITATIVPVLEARVVAKGKVKLFADGEPFEGEEFTVKVIPGALKIITGKGRKF